MPADNDKRLERRVERAAEEALAEHKFVSSIDVLCGLGWLHPSNVERWRRGRPARLEDVVFVEPSRIVTAIRLLQEWASERGLEPSERSYPARSRTPRELRFSAAGYPELERAYRTHWLSPDVSEPRRPRLTEEALERAEAECLADDQARARRREHEAVRRAEQDLALQERIADEIGRLLPGCPLERAREIAGHTAAWGSGRVGRSAAGRALEPGAIELAVVASVRHRDTRYDELLMSGVDRETARARVSDDVASTLDAWRTAPPAAQAPTLAAEQS